MNIKVGDVYRHKKLPLDSRIQPNYFVVEKIIETDEYEYGWFRKRKLRRQVSYLVKFINIIDSKFYPIIGQLKSSNEIEEHWELYEE